MRCARRLASRRAGRPKDPHLVASVGVADLSQVPMPCGHHRGMKMPPKRPPRDLFHRKLRMTFSLCRTRTYGTLYLASIRGRRAQPGLVASAPCSSRSNAEADQAQDWRVSRSGRIATDQKAVRTRGPGRVVLGSKPQLATTEELVSWVQLVSWAMCALETLDDDLCLHEQLQIVRSASLRIRAAHVEA